MTFAEFAADELSSTVIFAGQLITGASLSSAAFTVTLKLHCSPSSVVAVTTDVPIPKKLPEAGITLTELQVPPVVGAAKVTVAPLCPVGAVTVMLPGQVSVHDDGVGLETVASAVESLSSSMRSVVVLDAVAVEGVVAFPELELIS